MKPETSEWIAKAEDDFQAASALNRKRKLPLPDQVAFHCQQSAEKYLKTFLHEHDVSFAKTHDLAALLTLALPIEVQLDGLRPDAKLLTEFGVDFRYPGMRAEADEANAALKAMRAFRSAFRKRLLPASPRRKKKR
jgi:HEPN domain-containing protein